MYRIVFLICMLTVSCLEASWFGVSSSANRRGRAASAPTGWTDTNDILTIWYMYDAVQPNAIIERRDGNTNATVVHHYAGSGVTISPYWTGATNGYYFPGIGVAPNTSGFSDQSVDTILNVSTTMSFGAHVKAFDASLTDRPFSIGLSDAAHYKYLIQQNGGSYYLDLTGDGSYKAGNRIQIIYFF